MYRRFLTSKENLQIIQAYGFPYPTSPVRSLQRVQLMMNGRKSVFLPRSSADILSLQRIRSSCQMHSLNIPLPLRLRSERGQQHLRKRSLQAMKQCSLNVKTDAVFLNLDFGQFYIQVQVTEQHKLNRNPEIDPALYPEIVCPRVVDMVVIANDETSAEDPSRARAETTAFRVATICQSGELSRILIGTMFRSQCVKRLSLCEVFRRERAEYAGAESGARGRYFVLLW